jgi:glucan phosphoethanolaminetransferase (alkaline phosphatase superfamily)
MMVSYYVPSVIFSGWDAFVPSAFIADYVFFLSLAAFALLAPGPSVLYCIALYIAIIIPSAISSAYTAMFMQAPDAQAFNFLWETNAMETLEFLGEIVRERVRVVIFSLIFSSLLLVVLIEFVLRALRKLPGTKSLSRTVAALFSAAIAVALCRYGGADSNVAFRFYSTLTRHFSDLKMVGKLADSAKERMAAECVLGPSVPGRMETYVVVIGESASRHHLSVYGYPRITDPLMSQLVTAGEAAAFNNVSATSVGTRDSLMRAMTFMDQHTGLTGTKFSIVDVLNAAGFKTWWLSNNADMKRGSVLQFLSANADIRRFIAQTKIDLDMMRTGADDEESRMEIKKDELPLSFDGELLEWYEDALRSDEPRKVIFVHLRGSHVKYWYRYPSGFGYFSGRDGIRMEKSMSDVEITVVNDYDNSIRYTDYILSELTKGLRNMGGYSWLLYFSDHGEEVYDFEFEMRFGRNPSRISKYMLDVPVILWTSDEYRKNSDTSALKEYADRPYELDGMIHTIIDLANIDTPLLDKTKSLVSEFYRMPARILFNPQKMTYLSVEPRDLLNLKTSEEERRLSETAALSSPRN